LSQSIVWLFSQPRKIILRATNPSQDSYKLHRRSTAFRYSEFNRHSSVKEHAIESDSCIRFRILCWNRFLNPVLEHSPGTLSASFLVQGGLSKTLDRHLSHGGPGGI